MTASLTSKSEGDDCLYAWLGTALLLDIRGRAARPVIRRACARVGEGWSVLGAAVAPRPPHFRFIRGGVRRLVHPASLSRRWGPCRGRLPRAWLYIGPLTVSVRSPFGSIRFGGCQSPKSVDAIVGGRVVAGAWFSLRSYKTIFQSDFGSSQPKL